MYWNKNDAKKNDSKTNRPIAAAVLASTVLACCQGPKKELVADRTAQVFLPVGASDRSPSPDPKEIRAKADLGLYVRFGLHHNAGLQAAYESWRSALERIAQASSLPDPVVSFTQFVEDLQTRTGPQTRRYGAAQVFPWFGKLRLRGEVAAGAAEESWHRVEDARLQVQRDIEVAFYEYAYLARSIQITADVVELLHRLEPSVQSRVQGGAGQEDLLRLQLEIGKIEDDLKKLREVRPALSTRLAAAMNWPAMELLPLPALADPNFTRASARALLERAEQSNPKLRELAQRIRTNERALSLAELSRWPDWKLGVTYLETGRALNPGTAGSGNDPLALQLSLNLPIWGRKYDAEEAEAQHRVAAAQHARQDVFFRLRSDIELDTFRLADAARQAALYRDTLLPRSRELMTVTRAAYRAGTTRLLDLIDSERSLLSFELSYWRSVRDYYQAESRLQALVGGTIR